MGVACVGLTFIREPSSSTRCFDYRSLGNLAAVGHRAGTLYSPAPQIKEHYCGRAINVGREWRARFEKFHVVARRFVLIELSRGALSIVSWRAPFQYPINSGRYCATGTRAGYDLAVLVSVRIPPVSRVTLLEKFAETGRMSHEIYATLYFWPKDVRNANISFRDTARYPLAITYLNQTPRLSFCVGNCVYLSACPYFVALRISR